MPNQGFSVVIPTYNRANLVSRAIRSAQEQAWPSLEIIVVDDGSSDDTAAVIRDQHRNVSYLRQQRNSGVGAARNRGICEARNHWVVCLDDDDTLLPGALHCMSDRIQQLENTSAYPVIQFPRTNGRIPTPFMVASIDDYVEGRIVGDFVPVIQREFFLREGLAYPEFHAGAEGLLWLRVASKYGIPTWADQLQKLGEDAPVRMMSISSQLRYARDHAEVGESILREFGPVLRAKFPDYYRNKLVGTATYWMLAGNPENARVRLRSAMKANPSGVLLGLWGATYLPVVVTRKLFAAYRRRTLGWQS